MILLWILVKVETSDGFICKVLRIRPMTKDIQTEEKEDIHVSSKVSISGTPGILIS